MKKASRIVCIIVASILMVKELVKLIPHEFYMKKYLDNLFKQIENDIIISITLSILIMLSCCFIIVAMVYNLKEVKKHHSFKVGSKAFCSYFAKWYSQPGVLSIFCDDLESWVNPNGNTAILNALKEKCKKNELLLFLGKESPAEIISELRNLKAIVKCVPFGIINNYSFSCISVMGNHSAVIVRNKQKDKATNIIFEEISDTYISGLLNTIIKEGKFDEERK